MKPSRGWHLWIRTDRPVPCSRGEGYDIKGEGGYVLGPPSVHPSGKRYELVRGDLSKIPLLEVELLGLDSSGGDGQGKAEGWQDPLLKNVAEGERNNCLTQLCGRWFGKGLSEEEVQRLAIETSNRWEKPLANEEVKAVVRSVAKTHKRKHPEGSSSGDSKKKSQATALAELAISSGARFFHYKDDAYAEISTNGHLEIIRLRQRRFRHWLSRLFFNTAKKTPGSQALQDALCVLEGQAIFGCEEQPVYHRVAPGETDRDWWLDLANDAWQAVHIMPGRWELVTNPPVRFVRPAGLRPLPVPDPTGGLEELAPFVNVPCVASVACVASKHTHSKMLSDWFLLITWLAMAARPEGPYPILVLLGEQGSAKSYTMDVLCNILDPHDINKQSPPKEEQQLHILAAHAWLVRIDNISGVKEWLSDALCRLSTGGGALYRRLYTDNEVSVFSAKRPVIANGISDFIYRPDLMDRAIVLLLPRIADEQRREEGTMDAAFETAHPRILGALLNLLAKAAELHPVKTGSLSRMADFTRWACAVEQAAGWPPGSFCSSYKENREGSMETVLQANLVGVAIRKMIETRFTQDGFKGTAEDLLSELNRDADEATKKNKYWPGNPSQAGSAVRRLAPLLRNAGLEVDMGRKHDRYIKIRMGMYPSDAATQATQNVADKGSDPASPELDFPAVPKGERVF